MPARDEQEFRADPADRHDLARPSRRGAAWGWTVVVALAIAAAWWWWTQPRPPAPAAPVPQAAPSASAPAVSAPPAPVYPPPPAAVDDPLQPAEVGDALADLLGRKAVDSFLLTDDFARRFVATVDNLGRAHAPPAAWPVLPAAGRFTVEERPDATVIADANAARYTPLVLLAGTIDAPRAVRLYRRMYPLLQQSWREQGHGDRPFNDRLLQVIDLLLATPEPAGPPRVQLTRVQGPVPSVQPWTRYEFADPALEGLAAGQKILVRVGPVNERRLKNKLRELREQLLLPAAPASAPR